MSLLDESYEPFVHIDKATVPDGYGGTKSIWAEGAGFNASATLDTSMQARIGAVQGVKSLYTITTARNIMLEYHDVIRRVSDGKVFRVTSDGTDKKTPVSATLDMRQVTAEEYILSS